MRKGFSVTLVMVAFALLAIRASALAPVISDLPDIYIGDAENSSANNVFVHPDAYSLNAFAEDDLTSASALIWTFAETGTTKPYVINKALASDPSVDNLVSPVAAKRLDNQWDPMDPTTGTTGARTITFRDALRSPLTGTGSPKGPYADNLNGGGATASGSPTILDSRVLTMYCSDGSTMSLDNGKSFVVFTVDNGYDLVSYRHETVYNIDFKAGHSGWTSVQSAGTATASSGATNGLCITVPAAGNNDGQWQGAYPIVTLVQNSCWEARMTVTTDNTTVKQTPMWMLVYDNYGSATVGQNEYGGEFFFLDNEGGANSPIPSVGRSDYSVFMMPPQMQTPQFSSSTNGFFTTILDPNNDFRVTLRVFDYATGGYGAETDSGSVCWQNLTIYRHDLADMIVDSTVMNVTAFTNALTDVTKTANSWSKDNDSIFNGSLLTYSGTYVTLAPPTGGNWNTGEILMFRPGDQTINLLSTTGAENVDNYPLAWVSDTTYYVEFTLSAISTTTEANPPDVIRVGADSETAELTFDNFIVPNTGDFSGGGVDYHRGLSMPRTGTAQKYACFFNTHSQTKTGIVDGKRWRPRFEVLTNSTLQPLGLAGSPYGLIVNSCKIQAVRFSK